MSDKKEKKENEEMFLKGVATAREVFGRNGNLADYRKQIQILADDYEPSEKELNAAQDPQPEKAVAK